MNLPACLQIHISAFIFVLFIPVRTSFDLFCLKDTFNALRPLKLTVGKHIKKYFQRHCFSGQESTRSHSTKYNIIVA